MIVANALRLPYADRLAHACITSPPYLMKRRYSGVEPMEWPAVTYRPMPGLPPVEVPQVRWKSEGLEFVEPAVALDDTPEAGLLGLEPDPLAYIGHLVLIFREAWRVLRDDGVLAVNIGDTYNGRRGGLQGKTGQRSDRRFTAEGSGTGRASNGYKPKDLMGIPWRLAFALVADGWTLRSRMPGGVEMRPDVIWSKNAMPESVRDRPSVDFEDVFIFSKQRRYSWDEMAARVPTSGTAHSRGKGDYPKGDPSNGIYKLEREPIPTRNLRCSWRINTEPTKADHYAAYPKELVRRLIRIGTSDKGCCPVCGAQWGRTLSRERMMISRSKWREESGNRTATTGKMLRPASVSHAGWIAGCSCEAGDPVPCSVLDPFSGIGRTGEVCYELKRRYLPAELSPEYASIQRDRLRGHVAVAIGEGMPARRMASIEGPLLDCLQS